MKKEELIELLTENLRTGKNWVHYPIDKSNQTASDLTFFESCHRAERSCITEEQEYDEGNKATNYRYTAIRPIIEHLSPKSKYNKKTLRLRKEAALAALEKYPITPKPEMSLPQLGASLAKGELNCIDFSKNIVPENEIHRYHLYRHTCPFFGGVDSMHYLEQIGVFPNHALAAQSFEETYFPRTSPNDISEILLIGQYKDRSLDLDPEGQPIGGSGLLIRSMMHTYKISLAGTETCRIDPGTPLAIKERVFVDLDAVTNTLEFYDAQLQRINPTQTHFSANTRFFQSRQDIVPNLLLPVTQDRPHIDRINTLAEYQQVPSATEAPGQRNDHRLS